MIMLALIIRSSTHTVGLTKMKAIVENDFWFGFMLFVFPFLVVGAWEAGREKIQKIWLDGYSAGYNDNNGGK